MARFLPFLAWFVLSLYATIDCARTPRDRTPGGMARPLWIVVIWLIPILGALAWILVKAAQRAEDGRNFAGGTGRTTTPRPSRPGAGPRRRGPMAPDDDPDFLAGLAQQRRARLREERRRAKEAQGSSGTGSSATGSSAAGSPTTGSSAPGSSAPDGTRPTDDASRGDGVVDGDPQAPGDDRPDSGSTREERRDGPAA